MNENGITAKKLSDDTKISTGNISDWKTGRSKPSADKLTILAKYFNVSTDYLLGNEAPKEEPLDKTEKEILLLARKTKELPEADRQKLIKLFESSIDTFLNAQEEQNKK